MENVTTLAGVDLTIIIGFLVVVTAVGYMMSKVASRGLEDYFLGGKRIPWWVLGASTSTSNFDMAGTMIIVAVVFALGYKGFLVELRGGVGLSLAFLMVFLAKWLRRSRVMTSAEWMKIRFGTDTQGRTAHIFSAVAQITLALGMIAYFAEGAGSFLTEFLPFSEFTCTAGMVAIGLFYTLMAGLYGVVFTDIVQMILLIFTALFITVQAFVLAPEVNMPAGFLDLDLEAPAAGLGAALMTDEAARSSWEPILAMFGVCVFFWVFRSTLEGFGGVGGYTDQRFFASRNEREASLLTLEAIILSAFRWTMVAGLVVMGMHIIQQGSAGAEQISGNAEKVLPVVLGKYLPAGVKGLVIAGLISAAMSTFDSTLNAGAAYIVKDIYQSYVRPDATPAQLMRASHLSTIGLCIAGVLVAAIIPNINTIWGLITMGLGVGIFVPNALRWYWPRLNGYGFAAGTAAGIIGGILFKAGLNWPIYQSVPATVICAFAACVIVSLFSPATSERVLVKFWHQINPWGLWGAYAKKAEAQGLVESKSALRRVIEKLNDAIALCVAVPFQISVLLAAMAFVWHDWVKFTFFGITTFLCGVGLYFFWFKNLKTEKECEEDDRFFEEMNEEKAKKPASS